MGNNNKKKKEKKNRTTQIVIIIIIIIKQARGGMKKSIHFTMDSYSEPEFGLFFFRSLKNYALNYFFNFIFLHYFHMMPDDFFLFVCYTTFVMLKNVPQ
jgi:hypothetical protein